jgi:hypothetical protein
MELKLPIAVLDPGIKTPGGKCWRVFPRMRLECGHAANMNPKSRKVVCVKCIAEADRAYKGVVPMSKTDEENVDLLECLYQARTARELLVTMRRRGEPVQLSIDAVVEIDRRLTDMMTKRLFGVGSSALEADTAKRLLVHGR